jgi:hypothetical protein
MVWYKEKTGRPWNRKVNGNVGHRQRKHKKPPSEQWMKVMESGAKAQAGLAPEYAQR